MRFLLSSTSLFFILSPTLIAGMADDYDDSRRMACIQAMTSYFGHEHNELNDASSAYSDSIQQLVLEDSGEHVIYRTTYPNSDHATTQNYQKACEAGGNYFFTINTVVLECTKENRDSTHVLVDNGDCFPPIPECEYYKENPKEWILDEHQISYQRCDLRDATIDEALETYRKDPETPLPDGDAVFEDRSASFQEYHKMRRKSCLVGFQQQRKSFPDLAQVAQRYNTDLLRLDLFQIHPVIVQRQWYDNRDNTRESYEQLCNESGGKFQRFNGVLDCIGFGEDNQGEKITRVLEDASICFPVEGCEDYNYATYTIDSYMEGVEEESCVVRGGYDQYFNDNKGKGPKLVVGISLLVVAVALTAFKTSRRCHRGKKHIQPPQDDPVYLDGRYSDEDYSPQSEELNEAEMNKIT